MARVERQQQPGDKPDTSSGQFRGPSRGGPLYLVAAKPRADAAPWPTDTVPVHAVGGVAKPRRATRVNADGFRAVRIDRHFQASRGRLGFIG